MTDAPQTYAFFGGAGIPAPPYSCTGASLWSFVTLGDEAAITAYLAKSINKVTSPGRFVPVLGPLVFVLKVNCGALTSDVPPFSSFGITEETDIGFWLLVADTEKGGTLYWYPAYLFVDNWMALIAGREVWGFPKALATLTEDGSTLGVSTLMLKSETPQDKAVFAELFSIAPMPEQHESLLERLGGGIAAIIFACLTELRAPDWAPDLFERIEAAIKPGITLFPKFGGFLLIKQFRDANSQTGACYQAALGLLPTLKGLPTAGGASGASCTLTLQDYASQPITADLGLKSGTQDMLALFWVNFDFGLGFGAPV
jgi:hypothetical protein